MSTPTPNLRLSRNVAIHSLSQKLPTPNNANSHYPWPTNDLWRAKNRRQNRILAGARPGGEGESVDNSRHAARVVPARHVRLLDTVTAPTTGAAARCQSSLLLAPPPAAWWGRCAETADYRATLNRHECW